MAGTRQNPAEMGKFMVKYGHLPRNIDDALATV